MCIVFQEATKADIPELIRLRISYMIDDFGSVSDCEKEQRYTEMRYKY